MSLLRAPGRVEFSTGRSVRLRLAIASALVIVATGVTVFLVHQHATTAASAATAATVNAADPSIAGQVVQIGPNTCGVGWKGGHAGHQRFAFWNTFENGAEGYLVKNATGDIVLDAEGVGLNATRSYAVDLAPGAYHFACINAESGVPVMGPTETVSGSYSGTVTAGVGILSSNDMIPAVQQYGDWVQSQLPVLHGLVRRLQADLGRGSIAQAKRDWLTAHMKYETLGAAYDAFGDADTAINGMPTQGVDPVTDPDLVGFHKIEALLWSGAPARQIAPYAKQLAAAVQDLAGSFHAGREMAPIVMGLRSHEILENAVQIVLTGRDDAGSHTELPTLDANLAGTRQALATIRSLVEPRLDLTDVTTWLDKSQQLVDSYRRDGRWTPFTSLTQAQHEELNATLSQTVEYLSQVAVVSDLRQGIK